MKKFLLFSFLLLIGACSSVTWGQHTETIGNATWTVNNNGKITACTASDGSQVSGAVTVPNTVNDVPVTGFFSSFNSFQNNTVITSLDLSLLTSVSLSPNFCQGAISLTTVNFGTVITSISNYAFDGCTSLTDATLPDCVNTIGAVAFRNCSSLTSITIPAQLTSIDMGVITGCNSISTVTWNANIDVPAYAFNGKTSLTMVTFANGYSGNILSNAFKGCTSLQTVNFDSTQISYIGDFAFDGCTNLSSAMLPNTVSSIGSVAFRSCTHLKSIRIPSGVTTFDFTVILYDNEIEDIIWNSSAGIPAAQFKNNTVLKSFTSEIDAEFSIGNEAFRNCTTLTTAEFSSKVTSIGSTAFYGCSSLESVTIPDGITTFDPVWFYNCNAIKTINWYANIDIPSNAFSSNNIRTVNFKNTTNKSINASAFTGKTSLETVDFGQHITSIGDYAFDGCTNLSSIILPEGLTTIGSVAFRNCCKNCTTTEVKLVIPNSLTSLNPNAFSGAYFNTIEWNANVSANVSPNFSGLSSLTKVTFGSAVKNIPDNAFSSCPNLEIVNFGDSIIKIGNNAFYNCSKLSHVNLPDSLVTIGQAAFRGTAIEEIVIPDSVASIGQYAFRDCASLRTVRFMGQTPPTFVPYTFTDGYANKTYYVPCGKYINYTKKTNDDGTSTYTPCNANNTIEDCKQESNPYNISGNIALNHNEERNKVSISRNTYSTCPIITVGNYYLSANELSIDWTFDALHFYYFTLPFDCIIDSIVLDNTTIQGKYINDWGAALKDTAYDNGGWQILEYNNSEYVKDQNSNKIYPVVQKTGILKAGVGYIFGLLDPLNPIAENPSFNVKVTFKNADAYTFSKNIKITAPSVTTSGTEGTVSWNLYGNPFYWNIPVSNISNSGISANSVNVITPASDENPASVHIEESTYSLSPGEMFFYQVSDGNGTTISANPAPASSNAPARYSNQRPLRLTLSHNNTKDDHMFISSDIEASDRYVIGEDCAKMKNAGMNQIYTMIDDTIETAFNCLNLEESVRAIPVGLTIENAGSFEIAVEGTTDFMPGTVLKLRDTQTGAEYNLLNGPATLTLGKGITDGRYVIDIKYIPNGDETVAENASFSAFIRDGRLVVEGIVADDVVRVYDAAGRMVTSFTANSDAESLNLNARGVYFVNVNGETIKVIY